MDDIYRNSGIRKPTFRQLEEIGERHRLDLSAENVKQYQEIVSGYVEQSYALVDALPDESLPVKYPRAGSHKPSREENKYNAWYYKCDIKGASSGILAGKKVAIKDSILMCGVPMRNGSNFLSGFVPDEDATVVTRVLDAGGHILGKANCEEMSFSGNSVTCTDGPVLNPIDPERTAGGSSSGCAVLVQTGEVDMAIGGDQGGSVRIPSSFCGTVAIKPTYGLVPYTGAMSTECTIDHLGPMTRTVTDCALLLEAIAGYDEGRDFRQPRDLTVSSYSKLLTGDIKGMKIGFLKEAFASCEEVVAKIVKSKREIFEKLGAIVQDVSVPEHKLALHLSTVSILDGAYKTMIQNEGIIQSVKGHQNIGVSEHLGNALKAKRHDMSEALKAKYLTGAFVTENYGLRYYAKAHNILPRVNRAFDKVFEQYDVLVMPTLPFTATKLPSKHCNIKELWKHFSGIVVNTAPYNSTGHPAITVNAGYSNGLPVGLQIVGKHWEDAKVLNVGYTFEQNNTM